MSERKSKVSATTSTTTTTTTTTNKKSTTRSTSSTSSSRSSSSNSGSSMSIPVLVLLFATPFCWNEQWLTSGIVTLVGLLWYCCQQAHQIDDSEKWKIRFNIMEPADIVQTMADCEEETTLTAPQQQQQQQPPQHQQQQDEHDQNQNRKRQIAIILSTGLAALAKKYNAVRVNNNDDDSKDDDKNNIRQSNNPQTDELALVCQEAAYIGFRCVLDSNLNMDVSAASIALLALIAKNARVRERHRYQADVFGLNIPVQIIRQALDVGKDIQDDPVKEQEAAEIQRKSCLLLGALAEGDADLAQLVVGEGGIEVIMNAAKWYRFHAEVGNWALWALFILCFEYPPNKAVFVKAEGVALVIDIMRNCPESAEVARHGVALIFDLMRENPETRLDVWRIRKEALMAGLHEVLVKAMQQHSDAMDVMMMGSEILVGTGYEGEIPTFEPPEMNTIDR